jgi:hypothetical protein
MADQYASGMRKSRAMRNEAAAAIAVRAAVITAGRPKRDGEIVGGEGADGAVVDCEGVCGNGVDDEDVGGEVIGRSFGGRTFSSEA